MAGRGRKAGFQMGAEHRAKIANSQILKGLIDFAEGSVSPEEYPPHRVSAALGLLKKVMPDMTESMIKGSEKDGSIGITFKTIIEK
jgi:hypothetical protein